MINSFTVREDDGRVELSIYACLSFSTKDEAKSVAAQLTAGSIRWMEFEDGELEWTTGFVTQADEQ